ncbi:MAG: radical SAM protein [Planctomycetes bacterium]|nr:radical SAM protein [Planctomycetota bacterium]
MPREEITKFRYEEFGGIISYENPPMIVYADRELMKSVTGEESPLWKDESKAEGTDYLKLSAPIEVHLQLTALCDLSCSYCYQDAGPKKRDNELDTEGWKRAIDTLADRGVLSVAMGGGESTLRSDIWELAAYARQKGIIPNLTTNGRSSLKIDAEKFGVFGQINISVDYVGEPVHIHRPTEDRFSLSETVRHIQSSGTAVGINTVVHKWNFDRMESVVAFAKEHDMSDVELLRLKPKGRSFDLYLRDRMEPQQRIAFFPEVLRLSEKYDFNLKIDCSFVPFLACHNPSLELMQRFSVLGCDGGNFLMAVSPEGYVSGCSFVKETFHVDEFDEKESSDERLTMFRSWTESAREPCRSCNYLSVCRGGCHAVTEFVVGDFLAPDPECPRVTAMTSGSI